MLFFNIENYFEDFFRQKVELIWRSYTVKNFMKFNILLSYTIWIFNFMTFDDHRWSTLLIIYYFDNLVIRINDYYTLVYVIAT